MNKILFLDIDGVLNHQEFYEKRYELAKQKIKPNYPFNEFDPNSIDELNRIIDETDAKIVVSSSWRHDHNLSNIFKIVGIKYPIYDITPYLGDVKRGYEIEKYVNDNNIVKYAILDDDTDMLENQLPNFFKTSANRDGLNKEIADLVINHFNSN